MLGRRTRALDHRVAAGPRALKLSRRRSAAQRPSLSRSGPLTLPRSTKPSWNSAPASKLEPPAVPSPASASPRRPFPSPRSRTPLRPIQTPPDSSRRPWPLAHYCVPRGRAEPPSVDASKMMGRRRELAHSGEFPVSVVSRPRFGTTDLHDRTVHAVECPRACV